MRACLAFCFLAAAAASMAPSLREAHLRARLEGDSWVGRANAAILLSDEPRAVPWLARLVGDEAPPVRNNARWALHRLTGWPWETRPSDCLAALGGRSERFDMPDIATGTDEAIRVRLEWNDPDLVVSVEFLGTGDRPGGAGRFRKLRATPAERYSAIFFARNGDVLETLEPPGPEPGSIETRLFAEDGRLLAVWRWMVDDLVLAPGARESERYSLDGLPPGPCFAILRVGPTRTSLADETGADAYPATSFDIPDGCGLVPDSDQAVTLTR